MVDYKVSINGSIIRWENWKNFVESISGKKNKNTALLTIHFNNFENIKYLLDYIQDASVDFIIIENSTNDDEKLKLKEYIKDKTKSITIINPIKNIGSAGGYALGMEYIIDCDYNYFYIIEDDVIFLENDTINELLKIKNDKTLTFINNCKNTQNSKLQTDKGHSWWVQVAGYPMDFIKKIGIIDPRYFFRGEDLERGYKINMGLENYNYKLKVLDRNYIHPYLKSVNKNYGFVYFSIRNQLFSLKKNGSAFKGILFTIFLYICSGLSKFITELNFEMLKSVLLGVKDFLKNDYSFESNLKNIGNFINKNEDTGKTYNISKIKKIILKCYGNEKIMQISGYDAELLPEFSKKIYNIFYGVIFSSNSIALYFLSLLSKHIISIGNISINSNDLSIYYKNRGIFRYVFSIFVFIPIIFVSIGIYIIVTLAIILNLIFSKKFSK